MLLASFFIYNLCFTIYLHVINAEIVKINIKRSSKKKESKQMDHKRKLM